MRVFRMSKLIIAILGLWVGGFSPAHAASAGAVQAFNQGVQLFNANRHSDAITLFDKAIQMDPRFAEAYYARAACKQHTSNIEGAKSDLNHAIELKPGYVDAYALRGAIFYEQEQWDSAYQDFNYVLQRKPQDAQSLLGRGVIALRQERLKTARHDFKLFLKLRPNDPVAPKLREVLASLSEPEQTETSSPDQAVGDRPAAASTQRMARELFDASHHKADAYQRRAIRGERGDVVGDIQSRDIKVVNP